MIDPDDGYKTLGEGQHTKFGNAFVGGDRKNPRIVVAVNGGSDLIYIPDGDKSVARQVVDALLTQDYVSGLFVEFKLGKFRTLSLDDIALEGSAKYATSGDSGSISALSTRHAGSRCFARSGSPIPCCSKARACTARSVTPQHLEVRGNNRAANVKSRSG